MGRWSASHWKTATFGWLAFVVAAFAIGTAVGTKNLDANTSGPGESGKVAKIVDKEFKQNLTEEVIVQSSTLKSSDWRFRAAVDDVVHRLSNRGDVTNIRSPYNPGNDGQVSKDRHSALVQF